MYKIQFLKTGHIFVLPNEEAKRLKNENPDEYLILEKNGKKFKDKLIQENANTDKDESILSLILDE